MSSNKPNLIIIGIVVVLFGVVVLLWSKQQSYKELEAAVQVQTVPTGMLRYGAMGKILRKSGFLSYTANDFERFSKTEKSSDDLETITFQKKRHVDDYLFKAIPSGRINYTSSVIAKSLPHKKGWPILSIVIDDKHLNDPEMGILPNREKKGDQWEKIVELSYMEKGEILFETYVGMRMHGGERLITKKWKPGFKLYFRNRYGLANVPEGVILPDNGVPIRTLVLQTTVWPPGFPMNNPLAYDISREIECKVPFTRLVEVYLNGKSYGMCVAVEHISRRQWGQRFGHDDYSLYKFRSDNRDIDSKMYNRHFWETVTAKQDFSYELADLHIDLDNFSRHVFSWVFSGTEDFCQGVATYDHQDPEAKVSWINWDMDHSFYDRSATYGNVERPNWKQSAFSLIFIESHKCGRTKLFSRLMRETTEYREKFLPLIVKFLNHHLTQEFLHDRVNYYKEMMANFGEPHQEYIAMLSDFMDNRTNFILRDMEDKFGLSKPFSCEVSVGEGAQVMIDGYPYKTSYHGNYFTSTPVSISFVENDEKQIDHWLVNGEQVFKKRLQLVLESNTIVGYVLRLKE